MTYTVKHYELKKKYAYVTFNEDKKELPLEVFYRYHIKVGLELDEKTFQSLLNDAEYSWCKDKALRLLKVPKTSYEIKEKLSGFHSNIVKQVIQELKNKGYINDQAYMKLYHELRPSIGPKKLMYTFKNKGIDHQLIQAFLETVDEQEGLHRAFDKVYKKTTKKSYQKTKESIYQHLIQQGFSSSKIITIIDEKLHKNQEKEMDVLQALFQKTLPKLKGTPYEQCQIWMKKAVTKGFSYQDAKQLCEEISNENMD